MYAMYAEAYTSKEEGMLSIHKIARMLNVLDYAKKQSTKRAIIVDYYN